MGGCCGAASEVAPEETDFKDGPVKDRGCTDIFCVPIFIAAQVIFIIVTIAGMADGDPSKLYRPRDYRGAYCGVEQNWNEGPNTLNMEKQSYTMNVTATVDLIMQQMICSSAARKALVEGDGFNAPLITDEPAQHEYLCDCCLEPCDRCPGSLQVGGDLTDPASIGSVIGAKMSDLTNPSAGADLFKPGGANGDRFSATSFWQEATKYFNMVCLPDCNTHFGSVDNTSSATRSYTYIPANDSVLHDEWLLLLRGDDTNPLLSTIKTTIEQQFTFEALPESLCPYPAALCVPMPGIKFTDVGAGSNRCSFMLSEEVSSAIGGQAAAALEGLGGTSIADVASSSSTFGQWIGDFQECIDSFIVTAALSFVVGIVFMVLLRFFIGVCVWLAVFCTVLFFFLGGAMSFVRSGQCADAGFLESGQQNAVAIVVTAKVAAENSVSGNEVSEAMTGDGADYKGVQSYTRDGRLCARWDVQTKVPRYNSEDYPNSNLILNYCRNPYNDTDLNKAATIWCITSDAETVWGECLPVGVIQPECDGGYAVKSKTARDVLFYLSFVIWGLGLIWVIVICFMASRIRLAIALNKVAAQFLATNPQMLLLPIVQSIVGIVWTLLWMLAASFLLSQVPDSYTPTGYFATYAEAWGTVNPCAIWETGDHCVATPGKCTDKWPTGSVWKDDTCIEEILDGISVMKCWRCAPPRYIFDVRFAISFFVFLWNNAFIVALGQILVAFSVCIWFFAKEKLKTPVLWRSIKTILRYHLGSVAFGSFIVALVQFIRYCLKYLEKQAQAQKNRVMALVLRVLQCCLWCFEKCIKFLNKNAYIQIALTGKNFCISAKNAFWLIMNNALRFGMVAILGSIIHNIGFVCITVGTALVGYFLVRAMHEEVSPVMPVIVFVFMGYLVSRVFMTVFGLAVDTSLQCFLTVEKAKPTDTEFVPSSLKGFVDAHVPKKE